MVQADGSVLSSGAPSSPAYKGQLATLDVSGPTELVLFAGEMSPPTDFAAGYSGVAVASQAVKKQKAKITKEEILWSNCQSERCSRMTEANANKACADRCAEDVKSGRYHQ